MNDYVIQLTSKLPVA